jgi:signal transduction histidine kinase
MLALAAGVGWFLALAWGLAAVGLSRRLAARMELVVRACHELRGSITAARLGVSPGDRSPSRLPAVDLELGRAALTVEDLLGSCVRGPSGGQPEPLDLEPLLAESVEAWRQAADREGASLSLSWTARPALVLGHRHKLAQATGNLIANAIEHGGGEISVSGRLEGPNVRVEVTDHGPGLPAPLTELARRARGGKGRRGRGLAIALAVARDHGGRLAAAPSELGARLVLELPALPAKGLAARAAPSTSAQ